MYKRQAWLRSVLEEYPNCPTIVTTHDLQNCSDTQPSAIKLSSQGSKLWNIVKNYDQVFMMVGGHSHGSGVQDVYKRQVVPRRRKYRSLSAAVVKVRE